MISTSEAFAAAVGGTSRRFRARLMENGTEIGGELRRVTVHLGSCGASSFAPGAVFSSYAEITAAGTGLTFEGRALELQLGVQTADESWSYITLGRFTAGRPAASVYETTFMAQGAIAAYFTDSFTPPANPTLANIIAALEAQTGTSIVLRGLTAAGSVTRSMAGLTCRQALGVVAGVLGGYATERNDGAVVVAKYGGTATTAVSGGRMTALPTFADSDTTVTGVRVTVPAEGTESETEFTSGTPNVDRTDPYMTQALFSAYAGNLRGLTYRAGTARLALGDPRLEPWDVAAVTDMANRTFMLPCMSVVHTFDGGLATEVRAPGITTETEILGSMGQALLAARNAAAEAAAEALAAQDAAEAAQSSIDNLEIVGTNLVINTLNPNVSAASEYPKLREASSNTAPSTGTKTTAEHGIRVTSTDARRPTIRFGSSTPSSATLQGLVPGETYTFSFDAAWKALSGTVDNNNTYYARVILATDAAQTGTFASTAGLNFGAITPTDRGTAMTGRCEFTFTIPATTAMLYIGVFGSNYQTNAGYAAGDYLEIANIKLEKGNRATGWSPAPEDFQAQIDAANAAAAAMAGQITGINEDIMAIQAELDGQITAWYYEGAPTLQNEPAVHWTTAQLKTEHEGDTYTDIDTGYSYRFVYKNSVWQWVQIADSAATQALAAAQEAKDLADGKRRVFIAQPSPPYDQGDLWVQGPNGDILRCQTAKAEGASYAASDWTPASKYTDDARADAAQNTADMAALNAAAAQSTADSKAEVIYADAAPSAGDYNAGDVWISPDDSGSINGDRMWTYDGESWVPNEVGTAMIVDGCITADKIAANAVTANKIQSGSIGLDKLAGAVTTALSSINTAGCRMQTIYRQMAAGTNSVNPYTTYWVTYDGESVVTGGTYWTTKRPTYNSSYPVLFIAVQSQSVYQYGKNPDNSVTGYVSCTTPLKDDSTTIIDGGHITTGTIDASRVAVTNLNASNITTGALLANRIKLYGMMDVYTGQTSATSGGQLGYGGRTAGAATLYGVQITSPDNRSAALASNGGLFLAGYAGIYTNNSITIPSGFGINTVPATGGTAIAHKVPHKSGNFLLANTLWTNSSPGSTFAAQTLSTSAGTLSDSPSNYDLILIEYAIGTGETGTRKSEIKAYAAGGKTQMSFLYDYSGAHYYYFRNATLNSSSIAFDKGYYAVTSTSTAATDLNSVIIPTRVIGLRYT